MSISNLAIVEDAKITFKEGLNVLTGETGAGKSILINAISLLAGKKASKESVRKGFEQAYVEGVVEFSKKSKALSFLEEVGIAIEDETIIIKRLIQADGKNKVFLNQQVATVSTLQKLSKFWLDITSQHAQQFLLDESTHVALLDQSHAKAEIIENYQDVFSQIKSKQKELDLLLAEKQRISQEKDFIEFQFQELDKMKLKAGELEDLQGQYARVKHASEISSLYEKIQTVLSGHAGVVAKSSQVGQWLDKLSGMDESLSGFKDQMESAILTFQDLSDTIKHQSSSMGLSPYEVDKLNGRIAVLQSVEKKYGSVEQAIAKRDEIKQQLALTEEDSEQELVLKDQIKTLTKELKTKAKDVSTLRKKTATDLCKAITHEIRLLGMEQATLTMKFSKWPEGASGITIDGQIYQHSGLEQVCFDFSPNLGEGFQSLHQIASGGELSRILLAIKSIAIAKEESTDMTYLFDEVDAGVGGQVAQRIGQQMRALGSEHTQVFCVTHLAQVAAYANHHVKLEKKTKQGRTFTDIYFLDQKQRKQELARMIGGIELTENTYAFADELLQKSS